MPSAEDAAPEPACRALLSVDELMATSEVPFDDTPAPVSQEDSQIKAILEAIVYVAEEPLTLAQIAASLQQPAERVKDLLDQLIAEFDQPGHGVSIREVAGGYKMATKPEHHEAVRNFVKSLKPPLKLSLPALETLAVIAYKQPATGPEIMEIRGVQGGGVLKTLLDRKLIAVAGRKNVIGKPMLYKTTKEFLIQFGLKDLSELPSLKEFEEIRRMAFSDSEAPAPEARREAAAQPPNPTAGAPAVEAVAETPEARAGRTGRGIRAQRGKLVPEERLQKILSQAGVASRRQAEKIMLEGRVTVNGTVVTELGTKANLETDHIKVDGKLHPPPQESDLHRPEQAQQHHDHGERSRRPRHRHGSAPRREGAGVPRGTPGLSQRRPAAVDQRWRHGELHHVRPLPPAQDLRGEGYRPADRRPGTGVSRRHSPDGAAHPARRAAPDPQRRQPLV